MDIRPARVQDAAMVARLLLQLGYARTPEEIERHLRASADNPETCILVAVTPGHEIAGCLQSVVTHRLAEGDRGEIASLVVDAAWRGQGVGARLIRAAAQWLQQRGLAYLRVRCNVKRERAHRFYEKCGFANSKSQKVFDLKL